MYCFDGELDKLIGQVDKTTKEKEEALTQLSREYQKCIKPLKDIVDEVGLTGTLTVLSIILDKKREEDDPYCNVISDELMNVAKLTLIFQDYQLKKREEKKEEEKREEGT